MEGKVLVRRPRKLGFTLEVVDAGSKWFGWVGFRMGSRPTGEVLVFFPMGDKEGYVQVLDWEQCRRVES
jgi:hypothetical protein